ncbi:AGE family epimerase/isomerase [Bacteroides sp. GD17]|uniref:AGE family epimerase/isomerase n=1 Tax=Bacteroides sp. GD17 TaxID=3139826 RepID=UPI0025F57B73|nr:AGE family epimerase/isomerase [uncultured Bacteroides sp.]
MKRTFLFICFLFAYLFNMISVLPPEKDSLCDSLKSEIISDLMNNILPFWEKYSPSPDGGFYGTILRDGTPIVDSPRGCILNARILWTFARAFRCTQNENYKKLADRAYEYFDTHFINRRQGGVYSVITAQGLPLDSTKSASPLTYTIYALAEYANATTSESSLKCAKMLYRFVEDHLADTHGTGYFDSYNKQSAEKTRPTRTLDTHLHLMEAYTNLYKIWPDPELKESLRKIVILLNERFFQPETGHLYTLFDMDWKPLERIDRYGHDTETAWLLYEAASVLDDEHLKDQCRDVALKLCRAVVRDGILPQEAIATEFNHDTKQMNLFLTWWTQSETISAFLYAWKLTGDTEWLQHANRTWQFVKAHFIDHEAGGWFKSCTPEGEPIKQAPKGSLWNCPYHGSRMGFITYELLVGLPTENIFLHY